MTALQILFTVQTACQMAVGGTFCVPTTQPDRLPSMYETIARPLINQSLYNYSPYMYN